MNEIERDQKLGQIEEDLDGIGNFIFWLWTFMAIQTACVILIFLKAIFR